MKSFSLTDVGQVRSQNQDYVYASDLPVGNLPNLYIVADGMGGHKAGDLASSYAVQTIVESIEKSTETRPALILQKAVRAGESRCRKSRHGDNTRGGDRCGILCVCGQCGRQSSVYFR